MNNNRMKPAMPLMIQLFRNFTRCSKNTSGAVAVEYAFLIAFIAIVAASGMTTLGGSLSGFLTTIGNGLQVAGTGVPGSGSSGGGSGSGPGGGSGSGPTGGGSGSGPTGGGSGSGPTGGGSGSGPTGGGSGSGPTGGGPVATASAGGPGSNAPAGGPGSNPSGDRPGENPPGDGPGSNPPRNERLANRQTQDDDDAAPATSPVRLAYTSTVSDVLVAYTPRAEKIDAPAGELARIIQTP